MQTLLKKTVRCMRRCWLNYKKIHWHTELSQCVLSHYLRNTSKLPSTQSLVCFLLLQQDLPYKQKKKHVEPKKFELRPYQQELAERALRGDNCVIIAPTGSGKTHVAIRIIQVCFVKSLEMHDFYQLRDIILNWVWYIDIIAYCDSETLIVLIRNLNFKLKLFNFSIT